MCGIFGCTGSSEALQKCVEGLRFLEYRGYDSSGVAGIHDGKLFVRKKAGKLKRLEEHLNPLPTSTVIGHTRWATHGAANELNAHPHLDEKGQVAVVHNGIIENYRELRGELEEKGVLFASETDTEVIAQLIAHLYDGDLKAAVKAAIGRMEGFWALAIIHKDHPNTIVATRRENPIVVGREGGATFVSSDPYALPKGETFLLENDEVVVLTPTLDQFEKEPTPLELESFTVDKGPYAHFMLKEIMEQPEVQRGAIAQRLEGVTNVERVLILGCGSSWHAGMVGASAIEEVAYIPASCEIASEYRYRKAPLSPETLVIALSQSGETMDTIAAVKKLKSEGARILALCNVPGSTLMREADFSLPLCAGPEVSVCSTKTHTAQLAVLLGVAYALASKPPALVDLPELASEVLSMHEEIRALAQKYASKDHFFFLGRQSMHPVALEGALKLKEISYKSAYGYPAGEIKHGPMALVDESHLVIGMCGHAETHNKIMSNLMEVQARGAKVVAFAFRGDEEAARVADDVLLLPPCSDLLAPIPFSIAGQLFAYEVALACGREIDQPRNLAKSVTVE